MSQTVEEQIREAVRSILTYAFGDKGFKVLVDDGPKTGHFYSLLAVNGDVVLGPETFSSSGDDPITNHKIREGNMLHGNFNSVQRGNSSDVGSALYAYQRSVAGEDTL